MNPILRRLLLLGLAAWAGMGEPARAATDYPPLDPAHPVLGTLQSSPKNSAATTDAGARAVAIGIGWNEYEPCEGQFNAAYAKKIYAEIGAFRAAGKFIVLDLGVQYPPAWIFNYTSSHFVDQFGHAYAPKNGSGECGVNLVFSAEMRAKYGSYVQHVFADLGTDFYAVRLGGGAYGELGYPPVTFQHDQNCYWAFDPLAQGKNPGLPAGMQPCPVAGWLPGTASADHDSARRFADWYMESLRNYHDWQIAETRRFFAGPLYLLYPSTGGLRPGQLDAAIAHDLDGATGPEKSGEVSRGFDMARFIAGIRDPQVVVYSTWIDGFEFCDDTSPDPARWNPAHFLSSLAAAHQPPLLCGGENTGHPDDLANLNVTFQRIAEDHLCVMYWAFEPTLFDGKANHATLQDFKNCAVNMPCVSVQR